MKPGIYLYALCFAFLKAFVLGSRVAYVDVIPEEVSFRSVRSSTGADLPSGEITGDSHPIDLCDCEMATGEPNGLSCSKPGYFLVGFQREGSWVLGGGLVPLTPAQCCRPCLPASLEGVRNVPEGAQPAAILSIGCYTAPGGSGNGLMCDRPHVAVTGWELGNGVQGIPNTFYPLGPVLCCSPAVLLTTGDLIPLEQCACRAEADVSCSVNNVLAGYGDYRVNHLGQYVPIAPATCCRFCLGKSVQPPSTACANLDYCSGNGVCDAEGQCLCAEGWGGAACADRLQWGPSLFLLPPWALAGLGLITVVVVTSATLLVKRTIEELQGLMSDRPTPGAEGAAGELAAPLLSQPRDDGDVGSTDTDDRSLSEGASDAEIDDAISEMSASEGEDEAEGAGEGRAGASGSEELSVRVEGAGGAETRSPRPRRLRRRTEGAAPFAAEDDDTPASPNEANRSQAAAEIEADPKTEAPPPSDPDANGDNPLHATQCVVCFARPVQTVLVPCGHASLCRKCSRKVTRCPLCRKEVARRQKLFVLQAE